MPYERAAGPAVAGDPTHVRMEERAPAERHRRLRHVQGATARRAEPDHDLFGRGPGREREVPIAADEERSRREVGDEADRSWREAVAERSGADSRLGDRRGATLADAAAVRRELWRDDGGDLRSREERRRRAEPVRRRPGAGFEERDHLAV